ncbi:MAG: alpha/beta fold hydrolase [Anaerolineae bacterium]|nr:alpha/beta fold hydrolase [Anaerolineae bacterium]MDW8102382.1 alpha/beta fold hydrolase [Anaerolineae bacterium]
MEKFILKVLVSLSGGIFGTFSLFILVSVILESWMTSAPAFPRNWQIPQFGFPFEEVVFTSQDGIALRGWLFPPLNPDGPVVIYAHGSGKDLREGLPFVPLLREAGFGILLFSYRNHGFSHRFLKGHTYGLKESEDLEAAVHFLKERGYKSIAVIGYSLGAASAVMTAARSQDIKAVVAVAPFASVTDLWFSNSPPFIPRPFLYITMWLTEKRKGIKFSAISPVEAIRKITPRPILLIQGAKDSYISPEQTWKLFEAAGEGATLLLIEEADHKSVLLPGIVKYWRFVLNFLKKALATSTTPGVHQIPQTISQEIEPEYGQK